MREENKLHWIWLAEKCGPASKEFLPLFEKFGTPYEIYSLNSEETERISDISDRMKRLLCDKGLEKSYKIYNYCRKNGIGIITYDDPKYPERLKQLSDPPVLFYVKGNFPDLDARPALGIVGTRKMSEYGKTAAYKISYELSAAGFVIVSGMALGIDGVAGAAAVAADGEQVAVLGSGIDVIYPKPHKNLYAEIAKHGAVITEYPPGEPPNGYNFPKRNRIISGLAQGVLVVEGAAGSGSLITASKAIAQGRNVFALPGKINESNSEGPNELIKGGAYVVSNSDDIVSRYDFLYSDRINYKAYKKSKQNSAPNEKLLNKLGVSGTEYQNTEKPADKPQSTGDSKSREIIRIDKKAENKPAANPESEERTASSKEMLDNLDTVTRRIYEIMPQESPVSIDAITVHGFEVGEVLTGLTMLEILGLVSSVPGGAYIRK